MAWNYDDEEINGIVDGNLKDSPPNPPAVNTAATIRILLKSFWAAIRGQISGAVNYVDQQISTLTTSVTQQFTTTQTLVNNTLTAVEARTAAAEAKADSVFQTFQLADGLGTFNASTNVATLKEGGTTFTPTTAASQAKGKYFDIVVAGTLSITGAPVTMAIGGKLISRGTKWDYIPPADAAYQKLIDYKAIVTPKIEQVTGVYDARLTAPLPFLRYTAASMSDTPVSIVQSNLIDNQIIISDSGSSNDTYVALYDSTMSISGIKKASVLFIIGALKTALPCAGIGWGSTASGKTFALRSNGLLVRCDNYVATTLGTYAGFVLGDQIQIDLIKSTVDSSWSLNFYKNGNSIGSYVLPVADYPSIGNVLISTRGNLDLKATLTTTKDSSLIAESKAYTDGKVQTTEDYVQGVTTPVDADEMARAACRIHALPLPDVGLYALTELKIYCKIAGTAKIKFLSRNSDGTMNLISEFSKSFAIGLATLTPTDFGSFNLQPGTYIGIYGGMTGGATFAGIVGTTGSSLNFVGDLTGNNNVVTSSNYLMQISAKYSRSFQVKETANAAKAKADSAYILGNDAKNLSALVANFAVYVSKTGSDANVGSKAAPFLTISKALQAVVGKPNFKIIVGAGDYRETLPTDLILSETAFIISEQKAIVRVHGGQQLTAWVKSAGYSNLYEVAFAGTIPTWAHSDQPLILEDKNPSKVILPNQVHPLQKGLTHRLPYTEIKQIAVGADLAATLTTLDSNPGRYYFSGGKIYLHASGSTNPLTNTFNYEVPFRPANTVASQTNTTAKGKLILDNIQFCFNTNGFVSAGFSVVERYHCFIYGCPGDGGGWRDDAAFIVSYVDESAGCAGDGFNQHYDAYHPDYATQDVRRGVGVAIYFDPWAHDNFDDGMSCHQRSDVAIYGGLSEYNGDGGFVPANGGSYRCYNSHARFNQWNTDSTQAGFCTANSAVGSGRNQTTFIGYNCVSEGNKVNYANKAEAGSVFILNNCQAISATEMEYLVAAATKMIVNNCTYIQDNPAKIKSIGVDGQIIVNKGTHLS